MEGCLRESGLIWKHEGRSVVRYWDLKMEDRQTSFLIGNAGSHWISNGKHCNPDSKEAIKVSEYTVGITFDLTMMGINESTINTWGFATAIPLIHRPN